MTSLVPLSEAAALNPTLPRDLAVQLEREVHFVPMADVSENGFISLNGTRRLGDVLKGYTYFENGDVLVAKITPCMENGKAALVSDMPLAIGFGSTEFHVLRPRNGVCSRYLFYMVWNAFFRMNAERNMTGTAGQKRVPASFVETFKIPLPHPEEQQRIAAILDKADAIRRKREKGIRLTDELSRSAFLDMFGAPVAHDSKPLSEVAEVVSGVAKGRKLNRRAVVVPYLRVANVQDGFLNLDEIKTIEALPEEVENLALRPGDIVMTEGGDYDKLGRGAIWNHDLSPCIHQNHIFRVRLRQDMVLPEFFAAFLRTREAKGYFLRCAKKTTNLASINMSQLKGLPVPIPPITDQTAFRRVVRTVTEILERRLQARVEVDHLFASLVQRAFRGDL